MTIALLPELCVSTDQREELLRRSLFRPMNVEGVYARTALYEDILDRVHNLISCHREEKTEVFCFPPVMSRRDLERHGYLQSFPNLIACACALHGSEGDIRAAASRPSSGWTEALRPTDLVLSPAACYPLYPIVADRGPLKPGLHVFDVSSDCFRHEPSTDLDRLQTFRMREYVCFGAPTEVIAFRARWIEKAADIANDLGLKNEVEQASDPFFGRVGQMKAVAQAQAALKFELLISLRPDRKPTACMSFNAHRDHFGKIWGIVDEAGDPAHTGCVAFGMDRLTLALFWTHGLDVGTWPDKVQQTLGIKLTGAGQTVD